MLHPPSYLAAMTEDHGPKGHVRYDVHESFNITSTGVKISIGELRRLWEKLSGSERIPPMQPQERLGPSEMYISI